MADVIVLLVVVIVFISAVRYILKAKKNGVKCIGCPAGGSCCKCNAHKEGASSATCGCSCHKTASEQKKQ